ncbi:MAG: hypothetical protein H7645_11545 [Candidatus Heimdallarchaeota archaeon]|nr:hypothetical protein [Candidatus Heimdallarchaeota archaeon]MCK4770957.1 hypothetical protein [Candidatus Heimdallarchaeota archaeon]
MSDEKIAYEMPSDQEKKKWSFLGWGLLFLVIWTLALMFILEAALHPRDSYVATIVAYTLGLVGLGIFAGLTRSKAKVFFTIPVALIIVFGLGFLFHYINAPIYNPLGPVSERLIPLVDHVDDISNTTLWNSVPAEIQDNMDLIKQYASLAILVDLVIALPIFIFGTLSITWIVQLFTTKPKILTILSGFFALVFFLIGMVLTPAIHLLVGGVVDLGSNIGIGSLYMIDGFTVLMNFPNVDQTDINNAVESFNLAADWFQKGGEDIAVFLAGLGLIPYYGISDATDDFDRLFQAAFILFSGVGPFVNGSYQVLQGFELISGALNFSGIGPTVTAQGDVVKTAIDDDSFNEGLEYINEGLLHFNDSSFVLDEALEEVKQVNWEDILYALGQIPGGVGGTVDPFVDEIQTYLGLFDNATDLMRVLIDRPTFDNGTQSEYATLVHFFKGAYNLLKAVEVIGDLSNFAGTETYFYNAGVHLNITYNELNTPLVASLAQSETPILNDTLAFIVDATGLFADLSFTGSDLVPVALGLNDTLSYFQVGFENITDFTGIMNQIDSYRGDSTDLYLSTLSLENRTNNMIVKANDGGYGMFSEPALEFTTILNQLELRVNAQNLNAISNSLYYLFWSMEDLDSIHEDIFIGQAAFNLADYVNASNHFTAANASLGSAIPKMWEASYYMNQTESGGMIQLELQSTRDSIAAIYLALVSIQGDVNYILTIAEGGAPSGPEITEVGNRITNIFDTLANVNTQLMSINVQPG